MNKSDEIALEYLRDMTAVARKHDIIIAEPLEAAVRTYEPKHGSKLYWNSAEKKYVFVTPGNLVLG